MDDTIITSIRINKEVWKEARNRANNLDLSLGKFIESAIIHEIQKK